MTNSTTGPNTGGMSSVRVPWYDNSWDGTICRNPNDKIFCETLGRIRD